MHVRSSHCRFVGGRIVAIRRMTTGGGGTGMRTDPETRGIAREIEIQSDRETTGTGGEIETQTAREMTGIEIAEEMTGGKTMIETVTETTGVMTAQAPPQGGESSNRV